MAIGSSFVFLTPLTYTEFGQVMDAYYEARDALLIGKLMNDFREKEETYKMKVNSLEFVLDDEWRIDDTKWVKSGGLNGGAYALSHITTDLSNYDLPEDLVKHIKAKKPVLYTKWM